MKETVVRTIELNEKDIREIIAKKFGVDSEKVELNYGCKSDGFMEYGYYCNAKIVVSEE